MIAPMLAALIASVEDKKAQFDRLRPLSPGAFAPLSTTPTTSS